MQNFTLGPLPWSEEVLQREYFRNPVKIRKAIQEHPGFRAHRDLYTLQLSLDIFQDAVSDLMQSIDNFHEDAQSSEFWARPSQQKFKMRVLAVQRGIFCVATSAMALVDHSRVIIRRVSIPGYQAKVDAEFANSEEHQFIQSLRNCLSHITTIKADWIRIISLTEKRTQFLLKREQLLECQKWNAKARSFIDHHPEGIDVVLLFKNYRTRIEDLHKWFNTEIAKLAEPTLSEYLEYERTLNRFDANAWWKVILRQCIEKNLDPYSYLDQYLTKVELDEVLALPVRSQKQVDRIIEILDEYGACDEELRQMIYTAFGVDGFRT